MSPHTFVLATTLTGPDAAALVVDPALVVDVPFDEVELHPANSRVAVVSAATVIVPIRMRPWVVTNPPERT
jgi:hypothetical protein